VGLTLQSTPTKTSNNNEPTDKKPPTIPAPSLLVDSSSMAAAITADVKEYQESYVLEMDMAGLKSGEIKVEVEDDNVIVISGERKREFGVKYLRMERRVGTSCASLFFLRMLIVMLFLLCVKMGCLVLLFRRNCLFFNLIRLEELLR
jgi:hypothetical protein